MEEPAYDDLKTNETLTRVFEKHMKRMGATFPSRQVQEESTKGSTDMGNVTYVVPGQSYMLIQFRCVLGF